MIKFTQRKALLKNLISLSFCELKVFVSGILMLYHMITGKELTINDLWQKNGIRETDIIEVKGQISSVIFEHQEQELPHNPYDQEVRELDSIRHGDVEMLNRSLAETYRGEVGQLAKNQVRQAKNIAICVIALASRAAISGGMIPEEAFSIVDGYIMKIEELRSFSLSMNNPVHHFQRAAGSQNLFGNVISLSAAQFRVKFQQAPGQKKRFFQQILRRVFFVAQNFHYVPRFQHRPDAIADRLAAVGNHHVNFH